MNILDWWNSVDKSDGLIRQTDISEEYRDSVSEFIFGKTVRRDPDTNEVLYYGWDIANWVDLNGYNYRKS